MFKHIPYGNRLIIKKIESEVIKSEGGAYMSDKDVALGEKGLIIAAGKHVTDCQVGWTVIYAPGKAKEIYLDGVKYHTMLEQDSWIFTPPSDKPEERNFTDKEFSEFKDA